MQNSNTISYIDHNKVINIKSEKLFREAQDDFFFFNKIICARQKLAQAVKLTPNHQKSILLLADIYFIKGFIKKALSLYEKALKISPDNAKILASIANCHNSLSNYNLAINFCNKAILKLSPDNYQLFYQILEIKINTLLTQKKFISAYNELSSAKIFLNDSFLYNLQILHDKIARRKKLNKLHFQLIQAGTL